MKRVIDYQSSLPGLRKSSRAARISWDIDEAQAWNGWAMKNAVSRYSLRRFGFGNSNDG
jgi:hypothetical protein